MTNSCTIDDGYAIADIKLRVGRILKDLGNPQPPLNLEAARELLSLDLQYYSTSDPDLVAEISHKVKVSGKQIVKNPTRLIDAVKKSQLKALWLPDTKKILIDDDIPTIKQRWVEAHEIIHSTLPWHREFLLGDNDFTLSRECHETIEAEANFGAGELLFLGDRFNKELKDCSMSWPEIKKLKKQFGNSLTSTLWKIILESDPNLFAFGLISKHPNHSDIGEDLGDKNYSHFITSPAFRNRFRNVTGHKIYSSLESNVGYKKNGPMNSYVDRLIDVNGDPCDFIINSFCNSYHLLTCGVTDF